MAEVAHNGNDALGSVVAGAPSNALKEGRSEGPRGASVSSSVHKRVSHQVHTNLDRTLAHNAQTGIPLPAEDVAMSHCEGSPRTFSFGRGVCGSSIVST